MPNARKKESVSFSLAFSFASLGGGRRLSGLIGHPRGDRFPFLPRRDLEKREREKDTKKVEAAGLPRPVG